MSKLYQSTPQYFKKNNKYYTRTYFFRDASLIGHPEKTEVTEIVEQEYLEATKPALPKTKKIYVIKELANFAKSLLEDPNNTLVMDDILSLDDELSKWADSNNTLRAMLTREFYEFDQFSVLFLEAKVHKDIQKELLDPSVATLLSQLINQFKSQIDLS